MSNLYFQVYLKSAIRYVFVFCLILFVTANIYSQTSNQSKLDNKDKKTVTSLVQEVRRNRTMAESHAVKLTENFKPGTAQYIEAQRLYDLAFAEFDGFTAAMLVAIQTNKGLDELSNMGKTAVEANSKFCDYVDTELKKKTGALIISDAIKAIGEIISLIRKLTNEKRQVYANAVAAQIKWRTWQAVVTPKPV